MFEILSDTSLILFIIYFHSLSLSLKIWKVYDEIQPMELDAFSQNFKGSE